MPLTAITVGPLVTEVDDDRVKKQDQIKTVAYPDPGHVTFYSSNSAGLVTARLRGPVEDPVPRPRITTTPRPGRASLTQWEGREPYQTVVPIMFDSYVAGSAVEAKIAELEQFAIKPKNQSEPPTVRLEGPIPDRIRRQGWWVTEIRPVDGRPTLYAVTGDRRRDLGRSRVVWDVYLTERVADNLLDDLSTDDHAQGIHARTTKVLKGEKLRDVARRIYRDPSMAREIAAVNRDRYYGTPLKLGQVLPTHLVLKLPY